MKLFKNVKVLKVLAKLYEWFGIFNCGCAFALFAEYGFELPFVTLMVISLIVTASSIVWNRMYASIIADSEN